MKHRSIYNRIMALLLCAFMVCGSTIAIYADEADDAKAKAKTAQEKSEKKSEAAEKAAEDAKAAEAAAEAALKEIAAKEDEIAVAEAKLQATREKLAKKRVDVNNQETALDSRLVAMYKSGTVGYVDVILNSNSIDELITNLSMVQKLLDSDQKLLKQLKKEYAQIKKLEEQQAAEEAELETELAGLQSLEEKYKDQASAYRKKQESLKSEASALAAEAKKQQERAERILAEKNKKNGGEIKNTGKYVWPCEGPFTSYYGYRTHPIFGTYTYHSGYDIAASTGTPLKSAADGVVTMASEYGGYGNCLQIYIGNGYTTLYGHLSGFAVSNGDYVKKGQVVGYVGSTGWSTGPHLHYSLLKNGEFVDPMLLY